MIELLKVPIVSKMFEYAPAVAVMFLLAVSMMRQQSKHLDRVTGMLEECYSKLHPADPDEHDF